MLSKICLYQDNLFSQCTYIKILIRYCLTLQLCEYAQSWANHLAHTNTFYYRNDRNVGHNLYCRPGGAVPGDVTGQEVAAYWYSAVRQYDFLKEPDILHANVNAGKKKIEMAKLRRSTFSYLTSSRSTVSYRNDRFICEIRMFILFCVFV